MKCLLLDVGSTFIKYSFYEINTGKSDEIFSIPFPNPVVNDGVRFEVERNKIDEQIIRIFENALNNCCKRAFICVQMHGYFIFDGEKFSNYISWRDNRADINDERLKGIRFLENGTSLKRNLPAASLCTMEIADNSEFFTLGSYIAWLLTGNNATHKTDACASGFYNRKTLERNADIFNSLKLPKIYDNVAKIGEYKGIEVYSPTGDHQTSFLGSGADNEDTLLINVGTAVQITGIAPIDSVTDAEELRPYFANDKCALTVTGINMEDLQIFYDKIMRGIKVFGRRKCIVFGGGGAQKAFDLLKHRLIKEGYILMKNDKNIGNEGLKRIAKSICVERGTMLSEIAFANFPIIMKRQGLDFIIVDDEHGTFENRMILDIAQNSRFVGIKSIVRLPDNGRQLITKLADGGVSAFLLPMTNCAEDIKQVVKYAKYTPMGNRGISTTRAHTMYGVDDLKTYMAGANEKMIIYAQIETSSGVDNIEEILDTKGVEGVFIGPNDLSADLGCIGNTEPIKSCISKICLAAANAGKPCGIITNNHELIDFAIDNGVSMVSYGSEINMLKDGAKKIKTIF